MGEYLEVVREELDTGSVSARAFVLLFREAEEAEQGNDLQALEETLALARQAARVADETLTEDAARLVALCEERLQRARAEAGGAAVADTVLCRGCGRPVAAAAVRCRACGTLLV